MGLPDHKVPDIEETLYECYIRLTDFVLDYRYEASFACYPLHRTYLLAFPFCFLFGCPMVFHLDFRCLRIRHPAFSKAAGMLFLFLFPALSFPFRSFPSLIFLSFFPPPRFSFQFSHFCFPVVTQTDLDAYMHRISGQFIEEMAELCAHDGS